MNHTDLVTLRRDLAAEQASLDHLVASLTAGQWRRPTPSPGWTVADQIGHLSYFDRAGALAIAHPDRFAEEFTLLVGALEDPGVDEFTLGAFRRLECDLQLELWRHHRAQLLAAAEGLAEDVRIPWYGPPMSGRSFLAARLMETWAHGLDVADALGLARPATDRLRHVAQLGVITRRWSYTVRGEEPPPGTVRVELTGPSGDRWVWGDEGADDVVRGPAEDFCQVVTQRRHLDDTGLETGDLGRHWLVRAQAFAGGATEGPAKGSRVREDR